MSFHHHGWLCLDVSWRLWFPCKPLPILYQGEDSSPPPLALCFPSRLPPSSSVGLGTKLPEVHTSPGYAACVGLSKISATASHGAQCDSNTSNVPLQPATSLLHRLFSTKRFPRTLLASPALCRRRREQKLLSFLIFHRRKGNKST